MVHKRKNKNKNGFSLIELSVMLILAFGVFTSVFIGFSTDKKISEHKTASEKLKELKALTLKFYLENDRYPCPAAIERSDSGNFGKEAFNPATGFCDTSKLLSKDIDGKSQYAGSYDAPVAEDIVAGLFPCAAVGKKEDCAIGDNGDYYIYAVANVLTQKDSCDRFIAEDGSSEELPTRFKIMTDYDFNKTIEENKSEKVDPTIRANFVIIHYSNSGGFNQNGARIMPASIDGRYVGYNDALAINRDFSAQEQIDEFYLAPSKPLRTPEESVNETIKGVDLEDQIVYGSSTSLSTKICVACRNCDADASNSVVKVDNYTGCGDIAAVCRCAADTTCDQSAGECCNEATGSCGNQYCSIACTNNSECSLGNCCGDSSGGKTCDVGFCAGNPRCTADNQCPNGECCNLALNECNASYCAPYPACCGTDSCCDSQCAGYDAHQCACASNPCSDPTCAGYDVCTCIPSDPSCTGGGDPLACCSTDSCCNAACSSYDLCTCNPSDPSCSTELPCCGTDSCCDASCNSYDLCTCNPSDPSCGGEPPCCGTDSCCSASCTSYDLCACNPSDPMCAGGSCTVDADCAGGCCVNKSCTTCGTPPPSTCISRSECASGQACCNNICINVSALTDGNCPNLGCDPETNPCGQGFVCCSGICEETKIDTVGKLTGLAAIIKGGGGTLDLGGDGAPSSSTSSSSGGELGGSSSGSSSKGEGSSTSSGSSSTSLTNITISADDVCNTCQSDADCGGANCCNGVCSETSCQSICTTSSECTDPSIPFCCGNTCQAAPCSCDNNSDCSGATPNCCDGLCQAAPCSCSTNGDCPVGNACCGGQCQTGPCSCDNNSDCSGATPNCCNNTCQAQPCCDSNADCSSGQCCNTLNGQCSADYCAPSCCSTDSCCDDQCPGFNAFECACEQDSCISGLCPDYSYCGCNDCSSSGGSGSSSGSSSGGNCSEPNYECLSYTFASNACGPDGCCSEEGTIQWTNHPTPDCSNTVQYNSIETNIAVGTVMASGTTDDGISWEFVYGGIVWNGCPDCIVHPMCGLRIVNTCDILTNEPNNPGTGEYNFPVICKFGVNYGVAYGTDVDMTDIDTSSGNQGNEYCAIALHFRRNSDDNYTWKTRSTVGCSGSSSSGCGTLDGFCRNSLDLHPNFPIMCPMAP